MRTIIISLFLMLFAVSCNHVSRSHSSHSSIVILYDNDVHCAIEGYAKMAGLRDSIADTAYVAMVSSGDYLQGSTVGAISTGGFIADIMRCMHYDAVSLGNHEFDYGMPRQLELLQSFNAPVVCANLTDMQGKCVYSPYTICSLGNRKVAFVGVVTEESEGNTPYSFVSGGHQVYTLNGDKMVQLVQQSVDEARAQGCDYVIVLSHLGEEPVNDYLTSHDLVAATTGIDVVLDAHTHRVVLCDTVMNAAGQPVYISQTGTKFAHVGQLVISPKGDFRFELIPSETITYSNAAVANITDSIQTLVNDLTGKTAFHSDYDFTIYDADGGRKVRKAETNAGDLASDAVRYVMESDFGFNNGGSFRGELKAGDVTFNQIINMLPYDNRVVKIEATGATVVEMLKQCVQHLPEENGEFPQVSGLRCKVKVVKNGENVLSAVEVLQPDGSYSPIDPTATYTIGTTDYCAYKGGFHNTLIECPVIQSSSVVYRDVISEYVNKAFDGQIPPQYAQPQGRITIIR